VAAPMYGVSGTILNLVDRPRSGPNWRRMRRLEKRRSLRTLSKHLRRAWLSRPPRWALGLPRGSTAAARDVDRLEGRADGTLQRGDLNQRARSSVALADLLPRFVAKSALTFVTADLVEYRKKDPVRTRGGKAGSCGPDEFSSSGSRNCRSLPQRRFRRSSGSRPSPPAHWRRAGRSPSLQWKWRAARS
jgi:hypothetical protein